MKNKRILESILFISGEPVNIDVLGQTLDMKKNEIIDFVAKINEENEKNDAFFEIVRVGDKFQMTIKKDTIEIISPIFDKRQNPKLSNQAIEVLSIIAYNPEVTRAQIESIRGVASDGILHKLLDYGLIVESGRKETLGRPMGYKTTDKFLLTFGIESLKELPRLEEVKLEVEDEK